MSQSARTKRELRQAVGRALRGVREKGSFSLDDLARASSEEGVSVSRSHLSRVENGEADLSLPRFLVLMRVLGETRETVLGDLEARLVGGRGSFEELRESAHAARARHEHERVSEQLAAAFVMEPAALGEPDLSTWLRAEAALGRWRSSARIAQMRLARHGLANEGRALLEGAVALLGAGQVRASLAFARAALPHAEALARVVEGAALMALGHHHQALERVDALPGSEGGREASALALLVASSAYVACDRSRAATHAARSALDMDVPGVVQAEAHVALARAEGATRRPRAGLRLLSRALGFARGRRLIELSVRTQRLASALHRQLGERDESGSAARAARALAKRVGSDRGEDLPLPFQGLIDAPRQAGSRPSRS